MATGVRKSGGTVENVYSRAFNGFAARMTADQAKNLRSDGHVRSVTADAVFHCTSVQAKPPWVISHRTGPAVVNMSLGGSAYAPIDAPVARTADAGISGRR